MARALVQVADPLPVTSQPPRGLSTALALPAAQQPAWPDLAHARHVRAALAGAAPVTSPAEVDRLAACLLDVAAGRAFLLQGGDCAETFADSTAPHLRNLVSTLRQMALVLAHGLGMPVVTVGRTAGQYAKPRSARTDAHGLPSYRGDIVNSAEFTAASRQPNPTRMLHAHRHARAAARALRALTGANAPDLHRIHAANTAFLDGSPARARFAPIHDEIGRSLRFLGVCGLETARQRRSEVFASHEALLLDYESALTRRYGSRLYALSAPFLWVGERTRQIDGAHIAFAELVANPVGVKIGPGATPEQVLHYVDRLNPDNVPGRLTLITRMGSKRIRRLLPPIVEQVRGAGRQVIWQCDPMHGNTTTTPDGHKTREFDAIFDEVQGFFEVHNALGTHPGGLHVELTGADVTECLGGAQRIGVADLPARYRSACDPRLNGQQSLELAYLTAEMMRG